MVWGIVSESFEWRLVPANYKWSENNVLIESSAGRLILVKQIKDVHDRILDEIPVQRHEIVSKFI